MAQQDPTLMNATPSKKALLDSINTQIKAQTANQYGYSPYQTVGSLPAQEQDAILGDMANQITYKGGISVSKDDLKQLPVFRPPTFMDSLGNIGQNIGKGIIPERNAYPQEAPLDGWGTFGNAFTQSATGGIVDTKEGNNFWADFGGNLAGMGASIGAGAAIGAGVGSVVPVVGTAVGAGAGALIAGGLGAFGNTLRGYEDRGKPIDGTAFADATLQGGLAVVPVFGKAGQVIGKVAPKLTGKLASSALGRLANTGAGKLVGNTLLEGAENVVGEAGSQALRNEYDPRALALSGALGAGAGAGLHLSSKAIGKLAGKRAKITEAPSQKQAVQALQNEADNAPLPSQRNRARATLRRINTELPVQQPISTRKPFKTAIETPQAKPVAQKPVAVVPIKKKIKPPFQLPTKVVGGFKKKVVNPTEVPQNIPDNVPVSAEVAKPAVVDVSKTETTTGKKTRTDVLKASLERKEAKLNDLFENQFSHWKKTNGQPMNDKRSGASHFKKSDKNDDAIRSQLAEIEKTKKAIEKEAVKVEQSERVKNSLPSSIVELLDSGKITQWRKFPDTFFVKGVDKGRFQYKDGVLSNRYYRDIPTQEQKAIFKDLYNSLNSKIEQSKTEAPQPKQVVKPPIGIVPIKKKIKPPLQLPTKVVGGFKKKVVTPAKVAKPANVDVKRETTTAKKPWEMNKKEWDYERDKIRPETFGSASPKGAKSLAVSRIDRLEELNFGVYDNARNKLKQAQDLEIILTPDEVNNYLEEIQTHVTHKRVVEKALSEGKLVSEDVLKDYPDLQKKYAPTTKENLTVEPTSAKTAPVETTPAPKGKKGKLEPIKPNVVETRPKALKLNHDGVDFWVQKKWMRADGTLTASGVKSFEEARTKKQFFDSPEGKQAIENKQKRIDGAIQWALDKTIEDPSKNGVFKTSGASKIGETLAKLAESKGDFSFENMRKHHYLTGETATHTWELEHSKGYNPNASYDDVGSVTLRFKEKPPDTKVEPIPVKAKNHPPEVEGLKNGDKAPPMKEGESFDDYRARLEKQLPDGWGLRKASLDAGVVSLYEKTSKKRASAEGQADIEKVIGRPLDEASQDDLLKASKHFMEKATTDESPAITKANELIKKKANDAILEADARGEDTSVLRQAEANAIAGLDTLTEKGQIISVKDAPTEYELAIKRLKQDGNIDVAKVKAEADAVIKAIEDVEIPVKAINKGTRDIGTQLQDLKASQGTQVYTPDDIRRGVDVIGSHDSFLAQDTLEALGYPLKFSKNRKDPHSSGWSTVIGGKKIELYPGDSLGGLLRRNKISLNTLEKGLINKKYGDVVKRLVDDLDPNDLTLNETETRQKLTDYYDNLPKDGELLTSREAEAFSLLDNAKTPEELNAVERYVSENENDYQDGFHEEFYSQWNEKHKALEDGYKAGIENRVAKANETRQLKATEELKVLKKQLETETNKVLKLEKELALISPTVRLERKLQNDVLRNPSEIADELSGALEQGLINEKELERIFEGLSPEAREALAEEFSC